MEESSSIDKGRDCSSQAGWIDQSKILADELELLKLHHKNTNKDSNLLWEAPSHSGILELQHNNSQWIIQAIIFIQAEARAKEARENPYLGAKLVVASSENKSHILATAIELGRAGYKELAISAIIRISSLTELDQEERFEAILTALEPLVHCYDSGKVYTDLSEDQDCLFREVAFNRQITKTLLNTLDNSNGTSEESDLLELLNCLSEIPKEKSYSNYNIDVKSALAYATAREKRQKEELKQANKPIIRTIHHLACTGGTVISKCLGSMPDIALVSEINPFNKNGSEFQPTNPFHLFERNYNYLSTEDITRNFLNQISQIVDICRRDNLDLILRDHSHTDFCMGKQASGICPISDFLQNEYELISVISVRHPLDSYLGMLERRWHNQFSPNTLDEYSKRYLQFLEKYGSLEMIKYEDFCINPAEVVQKLCTILRINYLEGFEKRFGSVSLSGDSGRKDLSIIQPRPRRPVPEEIEAKVMKCESYLELVNRLGYCD